MWKKLISLNLVLLLLLGLFPGGALAEGAAEPFSYDGDRVTVLVGPEGETVDGAQAARGTLALRLDSGADVQFVPWSNAWCGLHWGTLADPEITADEESDINGMFRFTVPAEKCGVANPVVLIDSTGMMEEYYLAIPAWDSLPEAMLLWRESYSGDTYYGDALGFWYDSTNELEFIRRENGTDTPLLSGDLTCDSFFWMEDTSDRSVFFHMEGFGAGSITCGELTLPVEGTGPQVGFFSQPVYDWNYYLEEVTFTGDPITLYLVGKYGDPLGTPRELTDNGAEFASNSDGTVITVTLDAVNGDFLNVDLMSETSSDRGAFLEIVNISPHLAYFWAEQVDWDRITGEPVYGIGDYQPMVREIRANWYEGYTLVEFVWVDETGHTTLAAEELSFDGVARGESVQEDFTRLTYAEFGTGSVSYNGSSISVSAMAPEVGLYSSPEVSLDGYLCEDLPWSGGTQTVYLLPREGRITEAYVDTQQPVALELDAANGWAVLTLSGYDPALPAHLMLTGTRKNDADESYGIYNSANIRDCTPALYAGGVRRVTDPETGEQIFVPNSVDRYAEPHSADGARELGYFRGSVNSEYVVQFWLRQPDGYWVMVPYGDLTFEGENFTASDEGGGLTLLRFDSFGEGAVRYNAITHAVTARIETGLPELGFYTAPEATQENYITEWEYKGPGDVIYLAAQTDTLTAVRPLQDFAAAELDPSGKFAAVTSAGPGDNTWLTLSCDGTTVSGLPYVNRYAQIRVTDARPGLVWRWADWTKSESGTRFTSRAGDMLQRTMYSSIGSRFAAEFLWRESDGSLTPVNVSELEFPGDVIAVEETSGQFAMLSVKTVGTGTIVYPRVSTAPGEIPVTMELPMAGFYSAPEATPENYVSELRYTGGTVTLYFISRRGPMDMVSLQSGTAEEISFAPGSDMAVVTLSDCEQSRLVLDCLFAGSTRLSSFGLSIQDARPGLVWRWANWTREDGQYVFSSRPDLEARRSMDAVPGDNWTVEFLWNDGSGNLTPVDTAGLAMPAGIAELQIAQGQFAFVQFTGFGTGSIIYAPADAGPGEITVRTELPDVGFYSAPEATEANFMSIWEYTGSNRTVYLISRVGPLNQVSWENGPEPRIEFTQGSVMAALTLDEYSGSWMNIRYALTGQPWTNVRGLQITDARPGLVWRWAEYDHASDTFYTNDWTVQTRSLGSYPGYTWFVEFLWRNASGELEPISIADLVMPEGVGVLVQGKGQYAEIRWIGFGSGQIEYAPGGTVLGSLPVHVGLPDLGFYSAPVRAEKYYISADYYHGDLSAEPDKTVYLVMTPRYASSSDLQIYYVEATTAAPAAPVETEILPDGIAVRITQTLETAEDQEVTLTLLAHSQETDQIYEFNARLFIMGHRQELLLRRVLEPRAEYAYYFQNYAGMGQPKGEVLYILPLADPETREPYTGDLTCTEEGVVELELYDAENHIWRVTFLSEDRQHAWITGVVGGETRYFEVNPTGLTGDRPGEILFFDIADPPHDDYRPDGPWSNNYTVVNGDSILFQISADGSPVTGPLSFGDGVLVREVSIGGLEGVYEVSGLRPGWFTVSRGAAAASFCVLSPARDMVRVEAKAPTETEPGNIAYLRDLLTGSLIAPPELPYDAELVLTRAMLAQLTVTALGFTTEGNVDGVADYTDVDETVPERDAIRLLTKYGVMTGYPDGSFHPNDPATRAQAAAVLAKAMNYTRWGPADKDAAADVPTTHWAYTYVLGMLEWDIMKTAQTEDGPVFRPNETALVGDIDMSAIAMRVPGGRVVTEEETLLYLVKVETSGSGEARASGTAVKAGETVTLTAVPAEGFRFAGWRVLSGGVTVDPAGAFVMPASPVILEARWESLDEGISIDPEQTGEAEDGSSVEITLSLAPAPEERELQVAVAVYTPEGQFLEILTCPVTVRAGDTEAAVTAGLNAGSGVRLRVYVVSDGWTPLADYLDLLGS